MNEDFKNIDFDKIDADLAREDIESIIREIAKHGAVAVTIFNLGRLLGRAEIINVLTMIINNEAKNFEMMKNLMEKK